MASTCIACHIFHIVYASYLMYCNNTALRVVKVVKVKIFVFRPVCFVSGILSHKSQDLWPFNSHLRNWAEISHMEPRQKFVLVNRSAQPARLMRWGPCIALFIVNLTRAWLIGYGWKGNPWPRGSIPDFRWQGRSKDFFGFKFLILGSFWVGKFWHVFFGVAWFKIFLGIQQNHLKIRDSSCVSRLRSSANKVTYGSS